MFAGLVTFFLWATVLFANFAEAMAEGRGKAQAASLRKTRTETMANRRRADGTIEHVPSDRARRRRRVRRRGRRGHPVRRRRDRGHRVGRRVGDHRRVGAGRARVGRRPLGRDRRHPRAVRRDRRADHGEAGRDVPRPDDRARRRREPPEDARTRSRCRSCSPGSRSSSSSRSRASSRSRCYAHAEQKIIVLVALLVCLIPTTIGGLLSAIGIAGMDRLVQHNVLAMSGRAVEAAGDVSTLLLDKTGTITIGNREATRAHRRCTTSRKSELADAALLSSLADETPEGRSIVRLCDEHVRRHARSSPTTRSSCRSRAQTRMSGLDLDRMARRAHDPQGRGRHRAARRRRAGRARCHPSSPSSSSRSRASGGTPLVVAEDARILGVIRLKDIVKPGLRERFDELRRLGIRTMMITGDNPLTAAAIAEEAGLDGFLAEATPEDKLALIQQRAARREPRRDDRRRHQRRAGARAGRRRRRDEHRHASRTRGRQHGRPRLRPDEAHRGRRDRQAAADHPRLAHDVLDRQRRRQVLRDHPRDVRRACCRPSTA